MLCGAEMCIRLFSTQDLLNLLFPRHSLNEARSLFFDHCRIKIKNERSLMWPATVAEDQAELEEKSILQVEVPFIFIYLKICSWERHMCFRLVFPFQTWVHYNWGKIWKFQSMHSLSLCWSVKLGENGRIHFRSSQDSFFS